MCTFVVSDEMPIFVNMNYESYVDHKKKMWTKWYSNKRLQITVVIDFVLLARTQLHNYSHSRTKVLTWIHRYIYIYIFDTELYHFCYAFRKWKHHHHHVIWSICSNATINMSVYWIAENVCNANIIQPTPVIS